MLMKPLAVHEHLFIKIVCASKHFLCDDVGGKRIMCVEWENNNKISLHYGNPQRTYLLLEYIYNNIFNMLITSL